MHISISTPINTFKNEIGSRVSSLFYFASNEELVCRYTISLVLYENTLINTVNGEYQEIATSNKQDQAIAEAARALCTSADKPQEILLLMPSNEFLATHFDMAIKNSKLLKSALQLQVHSIIPAYEDALLLGVNASQSKGVALWFPAPRADSLFQAFKQQGLFLTAITPRSLTRADQDEDDNSLRILDDDKETLTQLLLQGNILKSFLSTSRKDLQQTAFAQQWQDETSQIIATTTRTISSVESWTGLKKEISSVNDYCFFPSASAKAAKTLSSIKKLKFLSKLAIAALILLCLPFFGTWIKTTILEAKLVKLQEQSTEARRVQASIFDMEEEWGPVLEFPDQRVAEVLLSLNDIEGLESSLTSFSIDRGTIEIEGNTQDPAYMVELLANKGQFSEITQSRSISGGNTPSDGDRFGIRMQLKDADFESYVDKYPAMDK